MAVTGFDCDRGNSGVQERADGAAKEVCRSLYWPEERLRNIRGGGSKKNVICSFQALQKLLDPDGESATPPPFFSFQSTFYLNFTLFPFSLL